MFGINKEEKKLKKELKLEKTLTSISGLTDFQMKHTKNSSQESTKNVRQRKKKIQKVLKKCINTVLTTILEWD